MTEKAENAQEQQPAGEPEKLDLRSHDIAADKREELLRLFPEAHTEGGKIDFDRLRLALGDTVDVGKERYGLTWPGKADCFKAIQTPSLGALRPCPEESVDFDTTENLIIEGDNLEVLKLLQKSYLGKVKMIYIDPPYNTGKDFIYPDDYTESLQTYLEYTCQVDTEGRKFGTNADTQGRFHSKWLNMLYPRLYLARALLRTDGVIFISIDDKELHNLRRLCDELFGEENRIGIITWKNVTDNNPTLITPDNEFIVCYARSRESLPQAWTSKVSFSKDLLQEEYDRLKALGLPLEEIERRVRDFISDNQESVGFLSRYKHVDDQGIYTGSESVHNPRPGGYDFEVMHPETRRPMRKPANGYRFPESTFRDMESKGVILSGPDENRIVKIKKYLADYEDVLRSVITLDGRLGTYELKRLFPGEEPVFTNPKPAELLESLLSFVTDRDSIVLDLFAGSGSTAEAVLRLNRQDGGARRFILVQLPEPTGRDDYPTIAEITKERVRRLGAKLGEGDSGALPFEGESRQDRGFRVFKLSESSFAIWHSGDPKDQEALAQQLELHVDHIREGRSEQDLLYEILLKSGFSLTTPVEILALEGKPVYSVAGGDLLVCLDRALTLEVIRAMAARQPARVVCLDVGFAGNDQLKANAVQTFKTKGVARFQTV
jgi:adenine-specific DNA-methyltransferase